MAIGLLLHRGETQRTCRATLVKEADQYLEASGIFRAAKSEAFYSPVKGRGARILRLVEDGSSVREGEIVAVLDAFEIEKELAAERATLIELEQDIASLERALEDGRTEESASRATSARALAELRAVHREYLEIDRPLLELEQQNRLKRAQQEYEKSSRKAEDLARFLEKGFASRVESDAAAEEAELRRAEVEEVRARLRRLVESEIPGKLRAFEAEEAALLNARERTQQATVSKRLENEASLVALRMNAARSRRQLSDLENQLNSVVLAASGPGLVVLGTIHDPTTGGARRIRVGDTVWPTDAILELAHFESIELEARIAEADVRALLPGAEAAVSFAAAPLDFLIGEVRRVGAVSMSEGGLTPTVVLRIAVREPPPWARPGMSGRARIRAATFRDVLVIPSSAIQYREVGAAVRSVKGRTIDIAIRGFLREGVVVEGKLRNGELLLCNDK
jgi:multidrug resistance efflux pump